MKKTLLTSALTLGMLCTAQSALAADLSAVSLTADMTDAEAITITKDNQSFVIGDLLKDMTCYTADEYAKKVETIKADAAKQLAAGVLSQSEVDAVIKNAEETLARIKNGEKVYHLETKDGTFSVTLIAEGAERDKIVTAMTVQSNFENGEEITFSTKEAVEK